LKISNGQLKAEIQKRTDNTMSTGKGENNKHWFTKH
jgi:hypothetical protein